MTAEPSSCISSEGGVVQVQNPFTTRNAIGRMGICNKNPLSHISGKRGGRKPSRRVGVGNGNPSHWVTPPPSHFDLVRKSTTRNAGRRGRCGCTDPPSSVLSKGGFMVGGVVLHHLKHECC